MTETLVMAPRDDVSAVETGNQLALKFNADGLIPVFTTDAETGRPLMQAFMSPESLALTLKTGEVHYYSRSRQEVWHKGATSGQIQRLKAVHVDCDQDSLWISVVQEGGGCCHVGHETCFFRRVDIKSVSDDEAPALVYAEQRY